MAIKFEKTALPGFISPFWRQEVRMLPGGFSLKQVFPAGDLIARGSFVAVDFDDMSAAIVKICKVLNGGTTSAPRVSKKNNLCVGDVVMVVGDTSKGGTVKSIDRTNNDYDVVTLTSAITGLAEGAFIQEAAKSDDTYSAKYVANAVLGADLETRSHGLMTLDAAWSAMVIKSIASPFPASWLEANSPCLATNHNILFINQ